PPPLFPFPTRRSSDLTAGEIVVVVADRSDGYGNVRAAAAGLLVLAGVVFWELVAGPLGILLWWDPGALSAFEGPLVVAALAGWIDRKSTRLNSSHVKI